MREFSTKFSRSHTSLSKLVNLVIYALFFHSHLIVQLAPLPLSPWIALLTLLILKSQTGLSIILLLPCGTLCLLIYVSFLIIILHLNLLVIHLFLLFLVLFLSKKSSRLIFFIFHFLHSLYSPRLPLDWYLRYWPSSVTSSHTHFVIIHLHFIHAYFLLFEL